MSKETELQKRLNSIERELDKCFDVLTDCMHDSMKQRAESKIERLELQKVDIEIDLTKLKIANGIRISPRPF